MIVLEMDMAPELGELFAAVVHRVVTRLESDRPSRGYLPDDRELAQIWSEDLKQQLKEDADRLVTLLHHPHFGEGQIELDIPEAESICRSASAVRLAIREVELGEVSDAELESGDADPLQFDEIRRRAFFCYWFLGGVQEMLLRALDPSVEAGEEEAGGES